MTLVVTILCFPQLIVKQIIMGSASQPMLVVKANRALLKKRRSYREIRESYIGYTEETKLHFKSLTPFQQKVIRDKIITQAKKDRLKEIYIYFLSFLLAIIILFGIYMFL